MSQAPQGKYDWAKDNYEKFLLLAALIVLLVSCVWIALRVDSQSAEQSVVRATLKQGGVVVDEQDTTAFDEKLGAARALAKMEVQPRERLFVSERRVSCVKCGKPIAFDALKCPFCLADQPEIVNIDTLDSDGDGIPDKIEQAWGLDPLNASDGAGDLDGDGFTNLEEFLAETNPNDAGSMPDPIVKLRVAAVKAIPFYLRFKSVSEFAGNQMRFQLNHGGDTDFVKVGDVVQGYSIRSYDPKGKDGATLVLRRVADGHEVRLVLGKPVTASEMVLRFVFLIDRSAFPPKRRNDTFELRGKTYKVVDIHPTSVVIEEATTGARTTVPHLSPAERQGPPGPAPAPVAADPAAPLW